MIFIVIMEAGIYVAQNVGHDLALNNKATSYNL